MILLLKVLGGFAWTFSTFELMFFQEICKIVVKRGSVVRLTAHGHIKWNVALFDALGI